MAWPNWSGVIRNAGCALDGLQPLDHTSHRLGDAPEVGAVIRRLAVRQGLSAGLAADLETWMRAERVKLSRHNDVANAMDYKRYARFVVPLAMIENSAEMTSVALQRNWVFGMVRNHFDWA
jgi:hypothetical protein